MVQDAIHITVLLPESVSRVADLAGGPRLAYLIRVIGNGFSNWTPPVGSLVAVDRTDSPVHGGSCCKSFSDTRNA